VNDHMLFVTVTDHCV